MKNPVLRFAPNAAMLAAILLMAGVAVSRERPSRDSQQSIGDQAPNFDKQIAPLLVQRCLDCHSGPKPKGGLDLSRREKSRAGGNQGPVLVPGRPDQSLLLEYVDQNKMPPKKPLAATEKALLRAWIETGARWGSDPIDSFRITTDKRAGVDWWCFNRS